MAKLLLHACCAVCGANIIKSLRGTYEVSVFYCNPNIYPKEEYEIRKNEIEKFCKENKINPAPSCDASSHVEKFPLNSTRSYNKLIDIGGRCGIKFIEDKYNHASWLSAVKGLEGEPEKGKRCEVCYKYRLEKTAEFAKQNGFDVFATTLSVSPHKSAEVINRLGKELAQKYGLEFYEADFKKQDGFKKAMTLARELNFYRQNYCGCEFSQRGLMRT